LANLIYHFQFPDGHEESLPIGALVAGEVGADLPPWTRLECEQCANCPLSTADTEYCPMAVRLVPLIELFGKVRSYDEVTARVDSDERTVTKRTSVQRVLRSLMGLLSASSDCPHVDFLKPMAHFHLPFSTTEETVYRVVSTYLLAQYFLQALVPADTSFPSNILRVARINPETIASLCFGLMDGCISLLEIFLNGEAAVID